LNETLANRDAARENNVRLNIRSTGHDFLGRSISPGSLSIWVHHFDSIEFHDDEFQLAGSDTVISGGAVTVGGGATMYNLYKATDKRGSVVVGGGCRTVSVGGFVPGGGHGLLTTDFGLAADNVLQVEVVTPDGEILIANEDQNSDLFWAIRGVRLPQHYPST
jgi:FAD/FMN-containing dehydrogenase